MRTNRSAVGMCGVVVAVVAMALVAVPIGASLGKPGESATAAQSGAEARAGADGGAGAEGQAGADGRPRGWGAREDGTVILSCGGVQVVAGPVVSELRSGHEGTSLIAVYLRVRNVGTTIVTFTPLDVSMRAGPGGDGPRPEEYAAYGPTTTRGQMLPGGALDPGETLQGWRVIEVPESVGALCLLYRSDGMRSAVEAPLPRLQVGVDQASAETVAQCP